MFGLLTRKDFKEECKKISDGFKDIKNDIVSRKEIELMIREAILKLREANPRTPMRKKADKLLNKAEIMQEIALMLQQGLSTAEMENNIINIKQLCRKSCFYKYLKKVRKQIARTTQTSKQTNEIN